MPQNPPLPTIHRGFLLPREVDERTERWTSPHYFSAPNLSAPQGILALVFPGTGGQPRDYRLLADQASALGLHALAVRYPNDTSINDLAGDDPGAHLDLRLDHWDGADRTGRVGLRPGESILERMAGALRKLAADRPWEDWGRFLRDGAPDWTKVAAVGHSLGAGYAALAAKLHPLERVVTMGWAEWCRDSGEVADWTRETSGWATGEAVRFSLLHERDEMVPVSVGRELADRFTGSHREEVVESGDPPWGRARRLVTDLDPSEEVPVPSPCHNSLAIDAKTPRWPDGGAVLADAWTWLLAGRA
jgi:dienelactone hydrolase